MDSKDNFMAFNEFYINPTYLGSPVPFQFEEIWAFVETDVS